MKRLASVKGCTSTGGRKSIDEIMDDLRGDLRRQADEGVLLDRDACEILVDWWDEREVLPKPKPRGRPEHAPMLDYMESEEERSRIVSEIGKERGSMKRLAIAMAKRWNTTQDAARKRIVAARKAMGKQTN
jgi:hypothetical protein